MSDVSSFSEKQKNKTGLHFRHDILWGVTVPMTEGGQFM